MTVLRKIIGVIIMVFFALPILFGVIWAVGVTRAVVSREFLSDMPREIIAEVPGLIDETFKAAQDEDFIDNENARAWLKAINEAATSPKDLMKEIGLLDWLQNELSVSLDSLGKILRGEMRAQQITLNMKPLKQAFRHKAVDQYVTGLLQKFPPCGLDQVRNWQEKDRDDDLFASLPACQPDPLIVSEALENWRSDIDSEIPDSVTMLENDRYLRRGFNSARLIISLTYLLFLIPAAIIAVGALIGGTSRRGFLQWSGVTTIIGGIIPLGMALFAKKIIPVALNWIDLDYSHEVSIRFQELMIDRVGGLVNIVTDRLFSPVIAVAGVVCIIGLILYALSYAVAQPEPARTKEKESTPPQPENESKTGEKPAQTALKHEDTTAIEKKE